MKTVEHINAMNEIKPDRVIYHYCDANALLSILEYKTLRFTHAAYLNDTLEIRRGVEFCRGILHELLTDAPNDPVLTSAVAYLTHVEDWQYYVCCFSESEDKLSQWRAYADDGAGFAIGFSAVHLSRDSDSPFECRLDKVTYDTSPLRDGLSSFVSDLQSQLAELPDDTDKDEMQFCVENAASRTGGWCIDQSAFHKDVGFIEEEEWRSVRTYRLEGSEEEKRLLEGKADGLVRRVVRDMQTALLKRRKVRAGRHGLTPYIDVAIQPESITEVICGPRTTKNLTESSLRMLNTKFGFSFTVSRSKATYR